MKHSLKRQVFMRGYTLMIITVLALSQVTVSQSLGWQNISSNIPGNPDLSDVFFVSDNEGWITSSSQAEIYHTSDGGATFEIQTTQFSTGALSMIDANKGYSGGASGRVYMTTNGGEDWTPIGFISSTLTDMDFASATQGYACGDNGAVFSITSEGLENMDSGQASFFSGISAPSLDNVWICGGGAILYYNGSTFTFQSGPAGSYNSIFFIDNDEGWVGGDSGITGHTADGGASWTQQSSPTINALYDLFFLDDNFGWAVGFNGIILSTANGGEDWNINAVGITTNFLRGVHFTSPSNGYVVGNGKTLLKYGEITGIGDGVETLKFKIFPNPAKDKFTIQSEKFNVGNAMLEIFDLHGGKLLEKHIPSGTEEIEIDVSFLKSGVYMFNIRTENRNVTKKLLIQK